MSTIPSQAHILMQMRTEYLDSLPYSQELFLELQINKAATHLIYDNQQHPAGYAIISDERILLEFYLRPAFLAQAEHLFQQCLSTYAVHDAYCKSFDMLMLNCCMTFQREVTVEGILFRNMRDEAQWPPVKQLLHRPAAADDAATIIPIRQGVFDTDQELYDTIAQHALLMYYDDAQLVGCGLFQPATKGRTAYDIGLLVVPDKRRQGYGSAILSHLRQHCLTNGWQPTCGCAADNLASRRTIERIGYLSEFRIFHATFT